MITWRDYQWEAIDKTFYAWETYQRILGVGATGMGKTQVMLGVVDRFLNTNSRARVLLVSHREELVSQPRERVSKFFPHLLPKVGIVMGETDEPHRQILIGTIQTVSGKSKKRLENILRYGPIDLLMIDECFVAGTMIDGTPIELLHIGDEVTAWDEVTKRFVVSRITRLFKNKAPDKLIKISFGDDFIVCTENHPILCNGEWKAARNVTVGDQLAKKGVSCGKSCFDAMRSVRSRGKMQRESRSSGCTTGARLLLRGMQKYMAVASIIGNHVKNKFYLRKSSHEEKKSDAQREFYTEDGREVKGKKIPCRPWWKWKIYRAASSIGKRFELGHGDCGKDRTLSRRKRLSILLQDRCRKSSLKDWCGGRRSWTQRSQGTKARSEKDGFSDICRVDSIEIIERGRDDRFGELCSDGFVYNIEVENQHTYTANGIVVHNCHHAEAEQYYKLYCALKDVNHNLKVFGVTATPERGDKKLLTRIFQHEAFNIGVRRLIDEGHLCEPIFHGIKTKVDLTSVDVNGSGGKRDYKQDQLVSAFETQDVFKLVVKTHLEHCKDRPTVIFTVSVEGAKRLTKMLCEAGVKAVALYGARRKEKKKSFEEIFTTDGYDPYDEELVSEKERRRDAIEGMKSGKYTCLVNVMILTEGFDMPKLEFLHIVRPTKSDALWIQMVGRILRLSPETGKTHATIFDYQPKEDRSFEQRMKMYKKPVAHRESPMTPTGGGGSGDPKPKSTGETEIILLDYFNRKQEAWLSTPNGWRCIQLGKGIDKKTNRTVDRSLALSPDGLELWAVWRFVGDKEAGIRGDRWAKGRILSKGDAQKNLALIEEYTKEYGDKIIMNRASAWRNRMPSESLIRWGRSLRVYQDGMKQGELSDSISRKLIMDAVNRGIKEATQVEQQQMQLQ